MSTQSSLLNRNGNLNRWLQFKIQTINHIFKSTIGPNIISLRNLETIMCWLCSLSQHDCTLCTLWPIADVIWVQENRTPSCCHTFSSGLSLTSPGAALMWDSRWAPWPLLGMWCWELGGLRGWGGGLNEPLLQPGAALCCLQVPQQRAAKL